MKYFTLLLILAITVIACRNRKSASSDVPSTNSTQTVSTASGNSGTVSATVTITESVSTNSQNSTSTTTNDTAVVQAEIPETSLPVETDTNVVRLVVSFISKGAGIDYETLKSFENWLAERPRFVYTKSFWGREGEVNLCFRMTNLSTREQEIFVRDVRTQLTDKDLVIVAEWANCDKRR
jgi:hypothetical protein